MTLGNNNYTTNCKNCPGMVIANKYYNGSYMRQNIGSSSQIITKGKLSPCIFVFNHAKIIITEYPLYSYHSHIVVSKGYDTSVELSYIKKMYFSGEGNPKYGGIDYCGIFMYENEKILKNGTDTYDLELNGDKVYSTNGTYSKCAPFITIVNAVKIIDFGSITLDLPSGVILRAASSDYFGTSGSNGADVTLYITGNARNSIEGDFFCWST